MNRTEEKIAMFNDIREIIKQDMDEPLIRIRAVINVDSMIMAARVERNERKQEKHTQV